MYRAGVSVVCKQDLYLCICCLYNNSSEFTWGVRRCGGGQLVPSSRTAQTATMGDMDSAACMLDHFDKIQKLPDPIPGVPNFRRVPGFKVRVLQFYSLRIHFY